MASTRTVSCIVYHWVLAMYSLIMTADGAPDNAGREFIVVYMENDAPANTISLELYVTTNRRTNVNVHVTSPLLSSNSQLNVHFAVTAGIVRRLTIPSEFLIQGSAVSNKAIAIGADEEVLVYAVNKGEYTNDAYMALPVDVLGQEYYTVSYSPATEKTQFAVVATEDCEISVKLPNPSAYFDFYLKNNYYTNGDTFLVRLSKFEAFQIQSSGDLTGTFVNATKPVAVFSGNVRTRVDGYSSDHLVEQLPPVSTWGKNFALVPTPRRTVGDFIRCVSSESPTTLTVSNYGTFTMTSPGEFIQILVKSTDFVVITSNKPIMVVQIVRSQLVANSSEEADPSMAVIFPTEQFAADATIATPEYSLEGSYINYFLIALNESAKDGLRLDHLPLNSSTQWTPFPSLGLVGTQIPIDNGSHIIYHVSPSVTFGGVLYGYAKYESFSMPLGMRLAPLNKPCVVTLGTTGDGLDNDCDGAIDEEICGDVNTDDDNDGNNDEDCAKRIEDVIGPEGLSMMSSLAPTSQSTSDPLTIYTESSELFVRTDTPDSATAGFSTTLVTTSTDFEPNTHKAKEFSSCPGNWFSCGPDTGRCIERTFLCDGKADCPDGRDEQRHLAGCSLLLPKSDTDNLRMSTMIQFTSLIGALLLVIYLSADLGPTLTC